VPNKPKPEEINKLLELIASDSQPISGMDCMGWNFRKDFLQIFDKIKNHRHLTWANFLNEFGDLCYATPLPMLISLLEENNKLLWLNLNLTRGNNSGEWLLFSEAGDIAIAENLARAIATNDTLVYLGINAYYVTGQYFHLYEQAILDNDTLLFFMPPETDLSFFDPMFANIKNKVNKNRVSFQEALARFVAKPLSLSVVELSRLYNQCKCLALAKEIPDVGFVEAVKNIMQLMEFSNYEDFAIKAREIQTVINSVSSLLLEATPLVNDLINIAAEYGSAIYRTTVINSETAPCTLMFRIDDSKFTYLDSTGQVIEPSNINSIETNEKVSSSASSSSQAHI